MKKVLILLIMMAVLTGICRAGGAFINCRVGGLTSVGGSSLGDCERFYDSIMEDYVSLGLGDTGVDPLHLFSVAFASSGCNDREDMFGVPGWQGGLFKVSCPCEKSYLKTRCYYCETYDDCSVKEYYSDACPGEDDRILEGVKKYRNMLDFVRHKALEKKVFLEPDQELFMTWYGYERGYDVVEDAISRFAEGFEFIESIDSSCQCFFGRPDGSPGECSGEYNDYARYCSGEDLPVFVAKVWNSYKEACQELGGTLGRDSYVGGITMPAEEYRDEASYAVYAEQSFPHEGFADTPISAELPAEEPYSTLVLKTNWPYFAGIGFLVFIVLILFVYLVVKRSKNDYGGNIQ